MRYDCDSQKLESYMIKRRMNHGYCHATPLCTYEGSTSAFTTSQERLTGGSLPLPARRVERQNRRQEGGKGPFSNTLVRNRVLK